MTEIKEAEGKVIVDRVELVELYGQIFEGCDRIMSIAMPGSIAETIRSYASDIEKLAYEFCFKNRSEA